MNAHPPIKAASVGGHGVARTLLEPDGDTYVGLTLERYGDFTLTKDGVEIQLTELEMSWIARLALDVLPREATALSTMGKRS